MGMKNEDVIFELDYIRDPANPQADAKLACGSLVQEAYKRGSEDNLTAVLARFQWQDVDAKTVAVSSAASAAGAQTASSVKSDATAQAAPSKPAVAQSFPGESAVESLKRIHREDAAERAEVAAKKAKGAPADDVLQ